VRLAVPAMAVVSSIAAPNGGREDGRLPTHGRVSRAKRRAAASSRMEPRMLLMIDNYDSFTYNLVQYMGELGADIRVARNDAITLDEIEALAPERIVISPGPCTPTEAGICVALIQRFAGTIPILGVCLGHQAIGQAFGGKVIRAQRVMHGKISAVAHHGDGIFAGLPSPFRATRYHSLAIERETLPAELEITAEADDGEIMGVRHREHAVEGVQFHPEAILTEHGKHLLGNFLRSAG
jgi:anthranilate synthase component 2